MGVGGRDRDCGPVDRVGLSGMATLQTAGC